MVAAGEAVLSRRENIYLLRPINRLAKTVTGQAGVTDSIEFAALELHNQARRGATQDRQGDPDLLKRTRRRMYDECDIARMTIGEPFLVFDLVGEFAYADTVTAVNTAGMRGHVKKRFFHFKHGLCGGEAFYARAHWPGEPPRVIPPAPQGECKNCGKAYVLKAAHKRKYCSTACQEAQNAS